MRGKQWLSLVQALACAALLSACAPANTFDSSVNEEFERTAQAIVGRDGEYLRKIAAPELLTADFDTKLEAVFKALPEGAVVDHQLIGWNKLKSLNAGTFTNYTESFQYQFPGAWVVLSATLRAQDGMVRFAGANVVPLPDDLRKTNAFNVAGRSGGDIGFLVFAFLMFGLSVITLISVIRMRKRLKRPVLWGIFAVIGVVQLSLNWTTDHLFLNPFSLGFFSAGAFRHSAFSPWMISIYFPIGVLLFWTLRWRGKLKLKDQIG